MIVDGQWLYLPQPSALGAWCWQPVALRDRVTGRVYSLRPGLTHERAELLFIAEQTRRWVSSEEGQATIRAALEAANRVVEELQAARRIDPATLHIPMTI